MSELETRMWNILRTVDVPNTNGKYKSALGRLVKKGLAVRTASGWKLSARSRIMV